MFYSVCVCVCKFWPVVLVYICDTKIQHPTLTFVFTSKQSCHASCGPHQVHSVSHCWERKWKPPGTILNMLSIRLAGRDEDKSSNRNKSLIVKGLFQILWHSWIGIYVCQNGDKMSIVEWIHCKVINSPDQTHTDYYHLLINKAILLFQAMTFVCLGLTGLLSISFRAVQAAVIS